MEVIPAPLLLPVGSKYEITRRVIAVGRYTYQKGFDLLIQAWILFRKNMKDWKLDIMAKEIEVHYKGKWSH